MIRRRRRRYRGKRIDYTYLGCPLTKNNSPWCYRMCKPGPNGIGDCGRLAPHSMKSRIQLGIEKHKMDQIKKEMKEQDEQMDKVTPMYCPNTIE